MQTLYHNVMIIFDTPNFPAPLFHAFSASVLNPPVEYPKGYIKNR